MAHFNDNRSDSLSQQQSINETTSDSSKQSITTSDATSDSDSSYDDVQNQILLSNKDQNNQDNNNQNKIIQSLMEGGSASENSDNEEEEEENKDDEYIPGTFEGPEKNLYVEFKSGIGHLNGCRQLTRKQLDKICSAAKCTIMSSISNEYFDAYVLSESSLFVYCNKIIIKTCGTTTLLRCLIPLLKYTKKELGLELLWLHYSRKNFTFPDVQLFPHSSFNQEFDYLKNHKQLDEICMNGNGYILGPITKDHWLAYVSDRPSYDEDIQNNHQNTHSLSNIKPIIKNNITINIMMFDLNEEVALQFYKSDEMATAKDMTYKSGIKDLVPFGSIINEQLFEPCGYSMNSILHNTYSTIHITPEKECSYASYETNMSSTSSYSILIKKVLNVFKPGRFVITMITDDHHKNRMGKKQQHFMCTSEQKNNGEHYFGNKSGHEENGIFMNENDIKEYSNHKECCPFKTNKIIMMSEQFGSYIQSSMSNTTIGNGGDVHVQMGNWELNPNYYEKKTVNKMLSRQRTLSF